MCWNKENFSVFIEVLLNLLSFFAEMQAKQIEQLRNKLQELETESELLQK